VWADPSSTIDFAVGAGGDEIWVADRWNSRVLRIANHLGQRDAGRGMFVDVILGQADLAGTDCNRGVTPTAEGLCRVYDVVLDASGNVYVGDNGGEGGSHRRILQFDAATLGRGPGDTTPLFRVAPPRAFGTGGRFPTPAPRAP